MPEISELQRLADEFESHWQAGSSPAIEEFATRVTDDQRLALRQLLAPIDSKYRQTGQLDRTALHEPAIHDVSTPDDATRTYQLGADSGKTARDIPTASMATNPSETQTPHGAEINVSGGKSGEVHKIGPYIILNKIAEHGQGIVYRANHPNLNRQVVIKVSRERVLASAPRALLDEAAVLAQLNHPNVATVYDLQLDEEKHPYLVMEYIEGRNLADALKEARTSPAEAVALISTVCSGLQHAHDLGIFHLDLKPANIVVRASDKVPKIIDFGLAQLRPAYGPTESSSYGGSFKYMAPEQAAGFMQAQLGKPITQQLDARADIYALGAILYELLTGQSLRPTIEDSAKACKHAIGNKFDSTPLDRADISSQLKSLVLRTLSTAPPARPSSVPEFSRSLSASIPIDSKSAKPNRTLLFIAAAGMVAILPIGYFSGLSPFVNRESPSIHKSQEVVVAGLPEISVELFDVNGTDAKPAGYIELKHEFIEGLHATHFTPDSSSSATFNQAARLSVRLPEDRFCYLIALNPTDDLNYRVQLLHPEDKGTVPSTERAFKAPSIATKYIPLNDGVGQQVYLLISSTNPLPSFAEWAKTAGKSLDWLPTPQAGFWLYSNNGLQQVQRTSLSRSGAIDTAPPQFKQTMEALRSQIDQDIHIDAIAFPIEPSP